MQNISFGLPQELNFSVTCSAYTINTGELLPLFVLKTYCSALQKSNLAVNDMLHEACLL